MASGLATGTMVWAAPLAANVKTSNANYITVQLFDNSKNLDAYMAANMSLSAGSPYKLTEAQIAEVYRYTDGFAIEVIVRYGQEGLIQNGHNGFCIFNELYADCDMSTNTNTLSPVPTFYSYYIPSGMLFF